MNTNNAAPLYKKKGLKGGIVFFKSQTLIGRLIRFFTRSDVTHVAVIIHIGNRILLLDSNYKKFFVSPLKACVGHCMDVEIYQPLVGDDVIQRAVDDLMDEFIETKYSILKFLGHGLAIFLRALGLKSFKNPVKNGKVCGDEVKKHLINLGFPHYADIGMEPKPNDIYHLIKNDEHFKMVVPFFHSLY